MFVSSLLNAVSISQLTSSQIPLRMSLMQSILACLSTPPLILLPQTDDFALLVNCTRKPPQRKERALQSSKGVFHGTQLGKLPSHTPSSPLTKTHYYVSVVSTLSVGSRGDDCATGFGERVSLFTSNCKWNSRHDVSSTFMHALFLPPSLCPSFISGLPQVMLQAQQSHSGHSQRALEGDAAPCHPEQQPSSNPCSKSCAAQPNACPSSPLQTGTSCLLWRCIKTQICPFSPPVSAQVFFPLLSLWVLAALVLGVYHRS